MPPTDQTGAYTPVSRKHSSRALATSMVAVAWPRPMSLVSRVKQMEPPPMPIFRSRRRIGQEAEALGVNHVARSNFHGIAVMLAHPFDSHLLPIGIALGAVDAQRIGACFHQSRYAIGIIAGN